MQLHHVVQTTKNNEINAHPRDFKGRIIFMSKNNDIGWTRKNNGDIRRQACARDVLLAESWTFLGPGDGEKWYGTLTNQKEN